MTCTLTKTTFLSFSLFFLFYPVAEQVGDVIVETTLPSFLKENKRTTLHGPITKYWRSVSLPVESFWSIITQTSGTFMTSPTHLWLMPSTNQIVLEEEQQDSLGHSTPIHVTRTFKHLDGWMDVPSSPVRNLLQLISRLPPSRLPPKSTSQKISAT